MNKPVGELIYTSYELEKWLLDKYGVAFPFATYMRDRALGSDIIQVNKDYELYFAEEGWSCLALLMSDFGAEFLVEVV